MIFRYEVKVSSSLAYMFREAFAQTLKASGFETIMELAAPGTGVWKFRKEKETIGFHVSSEAKRQNRIIIESETLDLTPLIEMAIGELADSALSPLLEALRGAPVDDLRVELRGLISRLLKTDAG